MKGLYYLLLSITVAFNSCFKNEASVDAPEKTRQEKWVEDIAYFENEFVDKAKTYTKDSKALSKTALKNLVGKIDELTDFQIRLELSKCVVMADNGHTTLPLPLMDKIPLRFYRFSDGVHIVKTDSQSSKYLGSKVLKLNSFDVSEIEGALFAYLSGIERWKKFKALDLLVAPKILNEMGFGRKDSITVTLLQDNDTLNVSFGAKKIENDRYWFETWANLYPVQYQNNQWSFIKKNKEGLPLYLKNAEEGVFYSFDEGEKLAYFHINSFWNKCTDIEGKIDDFNNQLKTKKDYDVVIDLRFYTGGNYNLFTALATKPPKIINEDKSIYLVVSNKTYSAGIVTAARVKHYSKDKIVIVGEEVGDRLKFWAEGEVIKLPNSGLRIYSAQKEHDWKHNKRSIFRTHFPNFIYGVAAKDLNLDKEIKLSFKEFMDNRDPVLEWIVNQKQ